MHPFAVPVLANVPATDGLTPLYVLLGSALLAQLVSMGFGLVKWLGSRTVEREDKDKEGLLKRVDGVEKTVMAVDRVIGTVQLEMKQGMGSVDAVKGMVTEIRETADMRFEKQGDYYRGQIKELTQMVDKKTEEVEHKLRQEIQMLRQELQMLRDSGKRRR